MALTYECNMVEADLPVDPEEAKEKALAIRQRHGRYPSDSAKYANVILPKLRGAAGYVGKSGGSLGATAHPPEDCDQHAARELFDELVDVYRHGTVEV